VGRPTDVRIDVTGVTFREIPFATPLVLSGGSIEALTEARVLVRAVDRQGRSGAGLGSVLLSHVWAGGTDAAMRAAVIRLADRVARHDPADPIGHGMALLDGLAEPGLPRLAAEVALGPVDQAVHDAWARAIGASAYHCYDQAYLADDLGAYLGPDFAEHWPADYLVAAPATELPVQRVVGVAEPLDGAAGYPWLKLKLSGDLEQDRARVRAAAGLAARLSLDPNEGYPSAARYAELAAGLDAARVAYVEQPVPRGQPGPGPTSVPVLADEGLPPVTGLDDLNGWDGVVVKTARGQTSALLTYCWARRRCRFVVQQDLTHIGPALAHAATFAACGDEPGGETVVYAAFRFFSPNNFNSATSFSARASPVAK